MRMDIAGETYEYGNIFLYKWGYVRRNREYVHIYLKNRLIRIGGYLYMNRANRCI